MPRKSMQANCTTGSRVWESSWKDTSDPFVAGYFGIQAKDPRLLDRWASRALYGAHAPFVMERGRQVDRDGARDYVYIAYWRLAEYRQWWALEQCSDWWRDDRRLSTGVGYWREIISMPFNRFVALHSSKLLQGVSVASQGVHERILEHGYPGSIRDRIPISDTHSLRRVTSIHTPLPSRSSAGGRRVTVVPFQNMCVIRTGQNWSACSNEDKLFYKKEILPRMWECLPALIDCSVETGCYSLRLINEMDEAWGAMEKSSLLAYAVDVHAYESWANLHSAHRSLIGCHEEMSDTFGTNGEFTQWHEVTALPRKGCEFEYIDCRPGTGLLGYT